MNVIIILAFTITLISAKCLIVLLNQISIQSFVNIMLYKNDISILHNILYVKLSILLTNRDMAPETKYFTSNKK